MLEKRLKTKQNTCESELHIAQDHIRHSRSNLRGLNVLFLLLRNGCGPKTRLAPHPAPAPQQGQGHGCHGCPPWSPRGPVAMAIGSPATAAPAGPGWAAQNTDARDEGGLQRHGPGDPRDRAEKLREAATVS